MTPEFPLPWWLRQAHEMYHVGQACPWWKPSDDTSGLVVLAIVEVHKIYQDMRLKQQAHLLGQRFGE